MKRAIKKIAAAGLAVALTFCIPAQTVFAEPVAGEQSVVDAEGQPVELPTTLHAPVLTAAIVGYQTVMLTWETSEQAVKYVLQQSTDKKTYQTIITRKPGEEMKFAVEGLFTKQPYYYRVIVKSKDGAKAVSNRLKVTPALQQPNVAMVQKDPTHVSISWPAVEGADFYRLYRSTTKVGGYKRIKSVFATAYDTKVETGVTYYYKLIPVRYNPDGKKVTGKASAPQSITTVADPMAILGAPANPMLKQDGKGNVTINWTASRAGALYRVYRADASGEYQQIATDLSTCTYTDQGLTVGGTYLYQIEAICEELTSEKSEAVSVTVGTVTLNTRTLFLGPGVSATLSAASDLPGKITYRSADPAIAAVGADGTVFGMGQGKTTVYAVVGDMEAPVTVTVTDSVLNGIDVSKWQQAIDWATVKASGIKFAMLRLAHGTSKDIQFENYYKGALEQGIPVGIYCYTLAKSVEEGIEEANYLLELLDGKPLTYPIALDLESDNQIKNMTKAQRTKLILEYKKIIEEAGYQFVVYANLNWLNTYIDNAKLGENDVDIWLARYRSQSLGPGYTGGGTVRMWQYTSSGQVDGILDAFGRYINVDLDVCYEGY